MCALDQEHAKLISASEDELEVEALSRVTVDTRWKINLYRWAPSRAKSKEIVNLLFAVQSQTAFLRQSSWLTSVSLKTWAPYSPGGLSPHLTRIFLQHLGRFGKQWQLTAAASVPFMEVAFIFCKQWEASLVSNHSWWSSITWLRKPCWPLSFPNDLNIMTTASQSKLSRWIMLRCGELIALQVVVRSGKHNWCWPARGKHRWGGEGWWRDDLT